MINEKEEKNNITIANSIVNMINKLNPTIKDLIYRNLWEDYVTEDVKSVAPNLPPDVEYNIINDIVYEGKMDSNISYWDNITNMINKYRNK